MKRVLVVEDEASIRELVALNLKMAGWDDLGLAAWTTFGPPHLSEDEERALAGSPFTYWRERRISQGVAADDRCRRDRIPHRPGRAPGDNRLSELMIWRLHRS